MGLGFKSAKKLYQETLKKLFAAAGMDVPDDVDGNQIANVVDKLKQTPTTPKVSDVADDSNDSMVNE